MNERKSGIRNRGALIARVEFSPRIRAHSSPVVVSALRIIGPFSLFWFTIIFARSSDLRDALIKFCGNLAFPIDRASRVNKTYFRIPRARHGSVDHLSRSIRSFLDPFSNELIRSPWNVGRRGSIFRHIYESDIELSAFFSIVPCVLDKSARWILEQTENAGRGNSSQLESAPETSSETHLSYSRQAGSIAPTSFPLARSKDKSGIMRHREK